MVRCRPRLRVPLGTERHVDGAGSDGQSSIRLMKRFRDWIGGAVWGVAVYKLWKRWREPDVAPVSAESGPDDRAEELRTKLAETRETAETSGPAEADEWAGSVEDRRGRVHEEGRAAIDEMRGGDPS